MCDRVTACVHQMSTLLPPKKESKLLRMSVKYNIIVAATEEGGGIGLKNK